MDKIFKIVLILVLLTLTAEKCFSQNTNLKLDEIYLSFYKSKPNPTDSSLIEYLMKQYYILDEIEKESSLFLNSTSNSEISRLEMVGYKFLENIENFEKTNTLPEKSLEKYKIDEFIYINSRLKTNYEIFTSFLNNLNNRKNLLEEFKNNNNTCEGLLIKLMQDFQK